ncbi:prepilin-type N-terminal cleavage/methylation domain-containing protein [Haloferula sargassicola]|uniref:Prepilin-type N-terminal cleavage/methylation domain-containing protein n=1 Tax=Haloferula sargassicola TaxID=490096 RepID=A0ABP9URZ1_9BACT
MKTGTIRRRRGFTLLELTMAMSIGLMVATMSLMMMNQQLAFLRIFQAQDFLTREAPLINSYVNRVISGADGYRLYRDMDSLRSGASPVLQDAKVLVLRYRMPDGSLRASALAFEDPGNGRDEGLYFHLIPTSGAIGDPDWSITTLADDVTFSIEQGILRMRLEGPNDEELVYSGTEL